MLHSLIAEFLGTALMILFGVGVHCDEVLTKTKSEVSALTLPWHYARQFLA